MIKNVDNIIENYPEIYIYLSIYLHTLASCIEVLQVCPYLWQDSEFAFECALCILLHLLDGDKLYASESPQQRQVLCQRHGHAFVMCTQILPVLWQG